MQIDELRGEFATLADEIEPFGRDVGSLHRRERRRRVVAYTVAGAVVVLVAVSTAAAVRHDGGSRVHIAGGPSKEVSPASITHVDAVVVPASPAVKAALDASPLVEKYAYLPRGVRPSGGVPLAPDDALCALQTSDGYAVDAQTPGLDFSDQLTRALTGQGTVYDVSDRFGTDFEMFLKVGAAPEIARALQTELSTDPDVLSVRFLDQTDAYAVFKKEFADQPTLAAGTKATDLPESFRVNVQPGHSIAAVVGRYKSRTGVDIVITEPTSQGLFSVALSPEMLKELGSLTGPGQAEVFVHVGAPQRQIDAIRVALGNDPDVSSFEFVDQYDAYTIFKQDFANQPAILRETKPSDLPASFRITLKAGVSATALADRYKHLDGVDTVITSADALSNASKSVSACNKPKP